MIKRFGRAFIGLLFALSLTALPGAAATADSVQHQNSIVLAVAPGAAVHKVTLCHATDSDTNPYVSVTVDVHAAHGSTGHAGHTGPVWDSTLKANHTKWGDIIPPYTEAGISFAGLNWSAAGQAIYNNGCQPVTPGQGGGGCTTNCTPTGGGQQNGTVSGLQSTSAGRGGGQVLGTSTVANSSELPNTSAAGTISAWTIATVAGLIGAAVYWRQLIVPLLPRR